MHRAFHAQHHFLVAAEFALGSAGNLGFEANAVAVTRVHAGQVGGKQGRFVAPGASADFDEGRALVVRVLGQQHALQLGFQLRHFGLAAGDFFLRHFGHVGVGGHILRGGEVAFALLEAGPAAGHGGHVGVFAREFEELLHVFHDVLAGQQEFEFPLAVGVAAELLAQKRFHTGCRKKHRHLLWIW